MASRFTGRLEDLAFLAASGESATRAAHRLGMTHDGLEAWAKNHAPDLWAVLAAREPADHNGHYRRAS